MTDALSEAKRTQAERDMQDCIVVRCGKCKRAVMLSVNDGKMDAQWKREIGEAVNRGCTVEHMTAVECRKQDFGCKCHD